ARTSIGPRRYGSAPAAPPVLRREPTAVGRIRCDLVVRPASGRAWHLFAPDGNVLRRAPAAASAASSSPRGEPTEPASGRVLRLPLPAPGSGGANQRTAYSEMENG